MTLISNKLLQCNRLGFLFVSSCFAHLHCKFHKQVGPIERYSVRFQIHNVQAMKLLQLSIINFINFIYLTAKALILFNTSTSLSGNPYQITTASLHLVQLARL